MTTPSLYEWIGGIDALSRLTEAFYQRVRLDDQLGPVFSRMDPEHPRHVAEFLAEVFGGPPFYSQAHGGHPEMVRHHLNRHLSEAMRRRWINLLLDTYTDLALPADPEFASALVSYLEWGSRLAVINSQPGAKVSEHAPMPQWVGARPRDLLPPEVRDHHSGQPVPASPVGLQATALFGAFQCRDHKAG